MIGAGILVDAGPGWHVLLDEDAAELMDGLDLRVRVWRHRRDGLVVLAVHQATRSTIKLTKLLSGAGDRQCASQVTRGGDFRLTNIVVGGGPAQKNESWASTFPVSIRDQFATLAQKGAKAS